MRKLIVSEFLTLDGVMEGPGPQDPFERAGWSMKFSDAEGMEFKLKEVQEAESLLLGRVTYEGFAAAWPGITDEAGFADKMNAMPKHVVSSTLTDPSWNNTTVLNGDVIEAVTALKEQTGGPILVGGSRLLVQALHEDALVDEYRLMVAPIVLGAGKRLFGDAATDRVLALTHSRTLPSGTLILTYEPASAACGPRLSSLTI